MKKTNYCIAKYTDTNEYTPLSCALIGEDEIGQQIAIHNKRKIEIVHCAGLVSAQTIEKLFEAFEAGRKQAS